MNGDWFWWGKKTATNGYKKLYRMIFDRLVIFHGLNNLIWVYGFNELSDNVDPYEKYYPGNDVRRYLLRPTCTAAALLRAIFDKLCRAGRR